MQLQGSVGQGKAINPFNIHVTTCKAMSTLHAGPAFSSSSSNTDCQTKQLTETT